MIKQENKFYIIKIDQNFFVVPTNILGKHFLLKSTSNKAIKYMEI